MAKSAIQIPGYVTVVEPAGPVPDLTLCELAQAAANLLSANADLPAPRYFSVSVAGQEIGLQFASDPSTFRAMAAWAERFGGTLTGEPSTDDEGTSYVRCEVLFDTGRAHVQAYAYIKAAQAT